MTTTPRPWKLVQYSTGLYIVDATGRTMAVAAVDRADQGEAVEEIRTSLAVAVHAVNMLDVMKEAQAALTLSLDTMRGMTDYFEDGLEKAMLDRTVKECKAVLAKLEDPHA